MNGLNTVSSLDMFAASFSQRPLDPYSIHGTLTRHGVDLSFLSFVSTYHTLYSTTASSSVDGKQWPRRLGVLDTLLPLKMNPRGPPDMATASTWTARKSSVAAATSGALTPRQLI